MSVRRPAVAGLFYPDAPQVLRGQIDDLLKAAAPPAPEETRPPRALIVPHAGYQYSGPIAASGYRWLAPYRESIGRVILLGPSHHVPFRGVAVPSAGAFATPLGEALVDEHLVRAALAVPGNEMRDDAHAMEHSLEVHVPFLQRLLPRATLLPLVVGESRPEDIAALLTLVASDPDTLIVVSTDLSHFLSYEAATVKDAETSRAIESRSEDLGPYQACGCRPMNGALRHARDQGWSVRTLDVRNSGDIMGATDRVVGYGAYVLH